MYLRTLGGLALEGSTLRRPKPLLLLAYLALEGSKSRRELAELFWMDSRDARDSLSTAIRRINENNTNNVISTGDRIGTGIECDALEFQQALHEQRLAQALGLYQGAFLDGLSVPLSEEVEEWVYGTRERLAVLARQAHLHAARQALERFDLKTARKHAEQALDTLQAPPPEPYEITMLIEVLRECGSPRTQEVRRLASEAGIDLGASIPGKARESTKKPTTHGATRPTGVPTALTAASMPFIGRHTELAQVTQALDTPHLRLLTLHGPGGVGKSRLAAQAAQDALDAGRFDQGVYLVPLESLTSTEQIPSAIADALRVQLLPHTPPAQQLAEFIAGKRVLLILDNAEHLLPLTSLLDALLQACPNLRLLVTSRVRLNTQHEYVLPVRGLSLEPQANALPDAVELFLSRGRKTRLDYQPTHNEMPAIRKVCELVEGFPLGIELAASWIHVLTPQQLASEIETSSRFLRTRCDSESTRHDSLLSVVNHSWQLLRGEAREALRRLAVFLGGFTREAAEEVTSVPIEMLRELHDASLLRVNETGRFDRHPLVYEFTLERLEEKPQEAETYRARHAAYFTRLLTEAGDRILGGPGLPAAARTVDTELANIRQAWAWATSEGRPQLLALGSLILMFYAETRGRYAEVSEITQHAIDGLSKEAEATRAAWAAAVACKAYTQFRFGHLGAATSAGLEAAAALEGLDSRDARFAAFIAAVATADVAIVEGNHDAAADRIDRALSAAYEELREARTPGDIKIAEVMVGGAHEIRGMTETLRGEYESAMTHLLKGEPLLRKHGSPILCNILWHLGQVNQAQGNLEKAQAYLEEGLELARAMRYKTMQAYIGADLARILFEQGDLERSEDQAQPVLQLAHALKVSELEVAAYALLGRVHGARAKHDEALAYYLKGLSTKVASESSFQTMDALVGASDSLAASGNALMAKAILSFVLDNPATPQVTRQQAKEELNRLQATSDPPGAKVEPPQRRYRSVAEINQHLTVVLRSQETDV